MTNDRDRLYSTAEVARRLALSPAHVRRLAARHGIGLVIGKTRVFTEDDVQRLRERNTQVGRPRMSPQEAPQSPVARGTGERDS